MLSFKPRSKDSPSISPHKYKSFNNQEADEHDSVSRKPLIVEKKRSVIL